MSDPLPALFDLPAEYPSPSFDLPDEGGPACGGPVFELPDDDGLASKEANRGKALISPMASKEAVDGRTRESPSGSFEPLGGRTLTSPIPSIDGNGSSESPSASNEANGSVAGELLPADGIRELQITPDVDAYLTSLEAAIQPYEAMAQTFAADMARLPIDTPQQLAALGQQSLVAKEREKLLDELFEPAIRKPRLYLDRVYALKRRVVQHVKAGGETAARRYTLRKRELEDADRRAHLEAARRQREAQREADEQAAAARQRFVDEATTAAKAGDHARITELLEEQRAVQPVVVPLEQPEPQAQAAAVAGMGERLGWEGAIVDMLEAVLAAARPAIFREVAQMVASGDLTAGGQSLTTRLIGDKLVALASELPFIPTSMFAGDATELKKRAAADRDTLRWPGFEFKQTVTPVRRTTKR